MPNSKVKFLRGSPSKIPLIPFRNKDESSFESPFNVSSEEVEHFDKITDFGRRKHFESLETDLNVLFQCEED